MPPTAATHAPSILQAQGLHKTYRMGDEDLHVLRGVDLGVAEGEWVAVLGASGSGKSTLLHALGGLDRPQRGQVIFRGESVWGQSTSWIDSFRGRDVGFVFQFYHLLPELNALENVLIGAMISSPVTGWRAIRDERRKRAAELLGQLGLGERLRHRPNKLSGGERQRVAIARAMINSPAVLLADEPTGNLDAATGRQILEVFQTIHRAGQTIVMVTHDAKIAAAADRQVTLEAGRLKA
ncbi:MAG: ABC transporter ATP-binding protein [Phycisphaeraceae bacterium]|nr:ABC transporter ATP-binding protein [Phycisphaeraceae bacterium]